MKRNLKKKFEFG